MAEIDITDYFADPYVTPQEQRLRFVARNGVQHASVITPNDPLPGLAVRLRILTLASLPIDRVAVYYTTDGSDPAGRRGEARVGTVVRAEVTGREPVALGDTVVLHWEAEVPGQPEGTLVRYRIDAWSHEDATGQWPADVQDPFAAPAPEGREFAYHVDRRHAPAWLADAVIYQIFVDRFAASPGQPPLRAYANDPDHLHDFLGGTLRGIIDKLDYLADLGVTCLWLTPLTESPTYHSYNPTRYDTVSARFGTNEDLRELIAGAHLRGMRVLLDFVANHTSDEHPAFLAARANPATAPTADWYAIGPEYRNGYLAYYGVSHMPVLRTERPAVRRYLIAEAWRWLLEFNADGLRLDNASGPTHAFWTHFQEGVKARVPGAVTLGEITGNVGDITSYGGRLDACMDFPLTTAMRRVFAQRVAPLDELLTMLPTHEAALPEAMARARVLDNHDMHRFLFLARDDTRRLVLALAFLMALPGFPILYYGTEVGLTQRPDSTNTDRYAREPMLWGEEQNDDLLGTVRALIGLRRSLVALRRGQMALLPMDATGGEAEQVGGFVRWTAGVSDAGAGAEGVIALFNNGPTPARYSLDVAGLPAGLGAKTVRAAWRCDVAGVRPLSGAEEATGLSGELPPMSALYLVVV